MRKTTWFQRNARRRIGSDLCVCAYEIPILNKGIVHASGGGIVVERRKPQTMPNFMQENRQRVASVSDDGGGVIGFERQEITDGVDGQTDLKIGNGSVFVPPRAQLYRGIAFVDALATKCRAGRIEYLGAAFREGIAAEETVVDDQRKIERDICWCQVPRPNRGGGIGRV